MTLGGMLKHLARFEDDMSADAFSSIDQQPMSGEALEHELTLMRACWAFFDDVRSRVSAAMQRGPHIDLPRRQGPNSKSST
jgi:hypothetical protein